MDSTPQPANQTARKFPRIGIVLGALLSCVLCVVASPFLLVFAVMIVDRTNSWCVLPFAEQIWGYMCM